jgi:hypothetical protein
VFVSAGVYDRIATAARARGISVSAMVEQAVARDPMPALDDLHRVDLNRVDFGRGLSRHVRIDVSADVLEDVEAQSKRSGRSSDEVLDAALRAMVDHLERVPWCRGCLESIEHCQCRSMAGG